MKNWEMKLVLREIAAATIAGVDFRCLLIKDEMRRIHGRAEISMR